METKRWYHSKTIITNIVAALLLFGQSEFGYVLPPEYQVAAVFVLNLILRAVTRQPLQLPFTQL